MEEFYYDKSRNFIFVSVGIFVCITDHFIFSEIDIFLVYLNWIFGLTLLIILFFSIASFNDKVILTENKIIIKRVFEAMKQIPYSEISDIKLIKSNSTWIKITNVDGEKVVIRLLKNPSICYDRIIKKISSSKSTFEHLEVTGGITKEIISQ